MYSGTKQTHNNTQVQILGNLSAPSTALWLSVLELKYIITRSIPTQVFLIPILSIFPQFYIKFMDFHELYSTVKVIPGNDTLEFTPSPTLLKGVMMTS